MRHLVEDETGGKWVVMPEDPVWWAVKELRKDIEYIVLTAYLIRTGCYVYSKTLQEKSLAGAALAYKGTGSEALGRNLARLIRLRVCLDRVGEMYCDEDD